MKKKIISLLLVVLMVLSVLPTAMAEGSEFKVSLDEQSVIAGESVKLTFSVENNVGFAGGKWYFDYDKENLKLESIKKVVGLAGSTNAHKNESKMDLADVGFINLAGTENFTDDAVIAELTFSTTTTTVNGTYTVSIITGKVTDDQLVELHPAAVNGKITVSGGVDELTKDNTVVTLAGTSYEYTGNAIEPGVTVKYNGATLTAGTDYEVNYANNTNVGTATVTVTGTGKYQGSATATFQITKASQAVTVENDRLSLKYGQSEAINVTAAVGTKTFKSSDDSIATVDAAGNVTAVGVGNAVITVTAEGNELYNKDEAEVNVSVAAAEINAVDATGVTAVTKVYDGTTTLVKDQVTGTVKATGAKGEELTVGIEGGSYASANVGATTATLNLNGLTGTGAANHELKVPTVADIPANITAASLNNAAMWTVNATQNAVINVGDFALPAADLAQNTDKVAVKEISYSVNEGAVNKVDSYKAMKDVLAGLEVGDKVAMNVTMKSDCANYKDEFSAAINISMVSIIFTDASDADITNVGTNGVTLAENLVYGMKWSEIVTGINMKASVNGQPVEGEFSVVDADSVPNVKDAAYTIVFNQTNGDEYKDVTVCTRPVEIAAKEISVVSADATSKEYDKSAALDTAKILNVTFDGAVNAVKYTVTDASIDGSYDAGDRKATFTVTLNADETNYVLSDDNKGEAEVVITPKPVTVVVAEVANVEYVGSQLKPEPTVTITGALDETVAYKYVYGANTNVGEGTVTVVDESNNYSFADVVVKFNITNVSIEGATVTGKVEKTYNAAAVTADELKSALTVSYKDNKNVDGSWKFVDAAPVNAGTYTVSAKFMPAGDNFTGTKTVSVEVKINKADAKIDVAEIKDSKSTLNDVLTITTLGDNAPEVTWYDKDEVEIPATTEIKANETYFYSVAFPGGNYNNVIKTEIIPYVVSTAAPSNASLSSGSAKHGSVTINPYAPEKGDKVVITVKPAAGYEVDEVTVLNGKNEVAVKAAGNNKFVFVMPAGTVKIDVTYKKANVVKFLDVADNAWYADSVYAAVDMGLFTGVSDNYFQPDGSMTRAMLVTVLWRLEGSPAAGSSDFADVANGSWYDKAVAWANEEGIVTGISDASFAPNAAITREQMATMLYRYAKYLGLNTAAKADLSDYADADKISAYAVDAMAWAVRAGLINGVTADTLAPAGTATRAQVATILVRFVEKFL